MTTVPLGRQAYKRDDGPVPEVQCLNFYLEKDESGVSADGFIRIQRPGREILRTVDSPARAVIVDSGTASVLQVGGLNFYVDGTNKGAVSDQTAGLARIVVTQLTVGIYANGIITVYDKDADTLNTVALPGDAGSFPVDIEQINGYIIVLLGSGRFYWMEPGAITIDALDFATAETSNDAAVAVRQVGNELLFFGLRTVEPWQPTGDQDLPFEPAIGRVIPHGCLAGFTAQRFDNTVLWVDEHCNVRRYGAVSEIISTPAIAERIRRRSTIVEPSIPPLSAWVMAIGGHEFYTLNIPGEGSYPFDAATNQWSRWKDESSTYWLPWCGDSVGGITWAGGPFSGRVWRIKEDTFLDDSANIFTRLLTGTVPVAGVPPRNDSLSIGVNATADTEVRLRRRDGQDDYPEDYYEIGDVRSKFDIVNFYRLGAPQQPYREYEISFVGAPRVSVTGCLANEAWQ